ncbi:type VI secretion system Vgr family protein [Pseudomonas sp.]|uniref:type VI secretion system Vgr family protein n=1 Tax=Pseudomonas sp. TaxID=306 RepID=UPI003A96D9D0
MLSEIRPFFDHSRHRLTVADQSAPLDVLAFSGTEALSETFCYAIEVTSPSLDIAADTLLGKEASFSLHAAPPALIIRGYTPPALAPLRTLHGVITGFRRLSASRDEARYELRLEPRLSLLDKTCQYRIYQNQSVPEVVETILRRHGWRGQDFLIDLGRTYKQHDQLLQYGESDLAYIKRLCAERGIWFSFSMDARLRIDVVEFKDSPMHYQRDISLPLRPLSGLQATGQDAVWDLQASHQVVQQVVSTRAYYSRDAGANLDGQADLTRGAATTYGEAYHYADEHYQSLGDPHARGDEEDHAESGVFYAQLAHERYLNDQLRLSGASSDAALAPGWVLKVTGGAPAAFSQGALIVRSHCTAARDRSFDLRFEAIPDGHIAFRPPVPSKPRIAGTVPARITSPQRNDPYSHIDGQGRYRVNFLFDRDTWPAGRESMWLRLARPYAGDTYGLHMPLLAGTEVAVAFEQGDPDRPFIAHALHTNLEPDHVTIHNHKRNVLRTPTNNKIRLDDTRGQEHIKVSTEYSGKSQLNLGHLVDAKKQKRGEGFELRTDGWGSVRAGKGVFISADVQPGAQGQVLAMQEAVARLKQAGDEIRKLSADAETAKADPADVQAQLTLLSERLDNLQAAVALISAPQGIAVTSGQHLQLAAERNLMLNAGNEADISVVKRLFIGVGEGLSLFVRKLGMKLIANQGAVQIQAQNDRMEILARMGLDIVSSEDEIHITAKKKILLNAAGTYIALDQHGIESGTQGDYLIKSAQFDHQGPASMLATHPEYPKLESAQRIKVRISRAPGALQSNWAGMPYTLFADGAPIEQGVLDQTGFLTFEHQVITRQYRLEMANGVTYQIPVPEEYRNPEQGHLANRGFNHHPAASDDPEIGLPASHTDHRNDYAGLLEEKNKRKGEAS